MEQIVYEEIRTQARKFGIYVEPVQRSNTKLQDKLGTLDLSEDGLRLNYEGYEYEVYYWISKNQTCMFHRSQATLTIAGSIPTTVQMMMAEIKKRAASRG